MTKLSETFIMMNSKDYKERFKAEYFQLKIRIAGLQNMLDKWDNNTLPFEPVCTRDMYDAQIDAMKSYLEILEKRAAAEDIDLSDESTENTDINVDDVPGHTKYLQGIDMPIMVNSIGKGNGCMPSAVAEMHVGMSNGNPVVLITPEIIALW